MGCTHFFDRCRCYFLIEVDIWDIKIIGINTGVVQRRDRVKPWHSGKLTAENGVTILQIRRHISLKPSLDRNATVHVGNENESPIVLDRYLILGRALASSWALLEGPRI
jgi:hypothetical protein